ncbi:ThiamineS protein [Candidatus Accumulibacter aalborgensis]|uniref:ThiamineS protein n=1 Tax=Candidatus Accumulibacter aalborgensis TaxID=1860102 RepID=A0A1A8XI23_9PROT|nr:MoaD/ThiS family protein [Candidatus Accumulibacter aalborgensis]SBT04839.1 ThiamineS protein [Candidatus Accumulibacter aalborgensis]
MEITFKLFASLSDYLPVEARRTNALSLEVPDGSTVAALIDARSLPTRMVHLVLVNGQYIPPAQRAERHLIAGDVLAIWPPIAGG